MIAQSQRWEWIIALFWGVPLIGLVLCWVFSVPWWLWGIFALMLISGLISHLSHRGRRGDWQQRMASASPEDKNSD